MQLTSALALSPHFSAVLHNAGELKRYSSSTSMTLSDTFCMLDMRPLFFDKNDLHPNIQARSAVKKRIGGRQA